MQILVAGSFITPTLATACAALPPEGALLAWGGPALRRCAPTRAPLRCLGFTLLELMVVIAIIAIATAGVTLSLRDSSTTALQREAQRVAAVLEAGRSQSRSTGLAVRWQPGEEGFTLAGMPASSTDKVMPWLTPGTTAQAGDNHAFVLLGPEPMIPAQSVTLQLDGRSISIATDGLRPFKITNGADSAAAP